MKRHFRILVNICSILFNLEIIFALTNFHTIYSVLHVYALCIGELENAKPFRYNSIKQNTRPDTISR